jgi:hypothetical protein
MGTIKTIFSGLSGIHYVIALDTGKTITLFSDKQLYFVGDYVNTAILRSSLK